MQQGPAHDESTINEATGRFWSDILRVFFSEACSRESARGAAMATVQKHASDRHRLISLPAAGKYLYSGEM